MIVVMGAGAVPASGQTVAFESGRDGLPAVDAHVRRVLERGKYRVIARDTLIPEDGIVDGDLFVLGASVRLEGVVRGDLVAVESDVFARPGSRIDGAVVVMAGGFYGSGLADVPGTPVDAAYLDYRVRVETGPDGEPRYTIVAPSPSARLRLPGIYGIVAPAYDRVNALSVVWGAELDAGGARWTPGGSLRLRYRTAPGRLDGTLALRWPLGRLVPYVRGGRSVETNEAWIAGDLWNSATSLVSAVDVRNYHRATFGEAGAALSHGTGVRFRHELSAGWERARSLGNRDPFSIVSDRLGFQPNPPIDPGDIASLRLRVRVELEARRLSPVAVEGGVEVADADLAGDFTFTAWSGSAEGAVHTFGDQALAVRVEGQASGSAVVPTQRWRALGGLGSVPTLARLGRRGDHLFWAEATYFWPVGVRLSAFGELMVWGQYVVGNAWTEAEDRPDAVHNLGLGVSLGVLGLGLYADPGEDFDPVVMLGIQGARYPGVRAGSF